MHVLTQGYSAYQASVKPLCTANKEVHAPKSNGHFRLNCPTNKGLNQISLLRSKEFFSRGTKAAECDVEENGNNKLESRELQFIRVSPFPPLRVIVTRLWFTV